MSKQTRIERKLKYDIVTPAIDIFHDKQMVVGRHPDMTYEEYKIMRRIQTTVLKKVIHRAGPKVNVKRWKYSRKKLYATNPTSAGNQGDNREISTHDETGTSQAAIQGATKNI